MLVSEAFKKDTLGKNTQIIPLVVIEKFISAEPSSPGQDIPNVYKYEFISTNNVEVGGNYFKPLLLKIPSIKQKVNLDTGKYQTSSVTLSISNMEYNNDERLSEALLPLTNLVVSIYYKSQSCTTVQLPDAGTNNVTQRDFDIENGCPVAFTGIIRKVSHSKDEITLHLEDISDKRMNKDLPLSRLSSSDNIPEKYKNSYYPMLYGKLKNAPTVGKYKSGRFTFNADSLDISVYEDNIQDYVQGFPDAWLFGAIKIYNEGYGDVTKYAHWEFVTSGFEGDLSYDITGQNAQQYTVNNNGSVSFRNTSMFNTVNRVEALFDSSPKSVLLKRNQELNIAPTDGTFLFASNLQFIQGGSEDQHIQEDEYLKITDKDYTTNINENHSSVYSFSNESGGTIGAASNLACIFSLQWDSGVEGAKYSHVLQNRINNIRIPTQGDLNTPSGLGIWDLSIPFMLVFDEPTWLEGGSLGYSAAASATATPDEAELTDLISFYDSDTYESPLSGNTSTMSYNENAFFKLSRTMSLLQDSNGAFLNTPYSAPLIRLAHGDNALPSCGDGWSSMEFFMFDMAGGANQDYTRHTGADITMNIDLDIQEIEVTTIVNYDDVIERNYYLNAEGRTDNFLKTYQHTFIDSNGQSQEFSYTPSEYLINPADIVRHILVEECGVSNSLFDEDEFNEAWMACHNSIRHDYSVNEKINSKDLFSEISKSSMITPRIKGDGKIGFITTDKLYHYSKDYIPARKIELDDMISYKLSLTPSNDIVSKLDVSYAYDYEQNKTLKTTDDIKMNPPDLFSLGINDVQDNYQNLDTKYIQDEFSANNLRDLKFYDKSSQHLQIELKLPLSYIDIETGDLIKITELIDGIKAYGIDYTKIHQDRFKVIETGQLIKIGSLRYPLFQVIDIVKNIDSVTLKMHQLHALDSISNLWVTEGHASDWYNSFELEQDFDFIPYVIDGFESFGEFYIGNNSAFILGDNSYLSSYSRTIAITDLTIGNNYLPGYPLSFNLRSQLDNIFGLSNFGLTQWEDLIPSANSDNSGYGLLTNGSDVSNFIAMEVRFHRINGGLNKVLSLRNIKDTEFDNELYAPSTTSIPQQLVASSTEIKLGWVLYSSDADFNYINPWGYIASLVVQDNDTAIHPYGGIIDLVPTEISSEWEIILYPNLNPIQDLSLTYSTSVESLLEMPFNLAGDSNLDGSVNVLDVVGMVAHITGHSLLGEEGQLNADFNEDGIVDILDVVQIIAYILGNPYE